MGTFLVILLGFCVFILMISLYLFLMTLLSEVFGINMFVSSLILILLTVALSMI